MVSFCSLAARDRDLGLTSDCSIDTETKIIYPKSLECPQTPFWSTNTRIVSRCWFEKQPIALSREAWCGSFGLSMGL